MENTEDRAGATSEQQDNVINTVNSLDPYGPSWQLVPGNVAAGTVYAQVPTSGTGDLTFTRASTATRTNSAGNIVDVASGVPRIHYRNADGSLSSTGRLLLEPQRTNSMLYSELINSWATKTELTITDNYTISPDGTQNASYIQQTIGGNAVNFISQTVNVISGQIQTVSFFAKAKEVTSITLRLGVASAWGVRPRFTCNLTNGTITLNEGTATVSSQNMGNGWYRFVIIATAAATTGTNIQTVTGATISPTTGDGFYLWGAQWEQNASYATTYIRTTTAAVTRLAEAALKTGVSDLIGQTEGTLFLEFVAQLSGANQCFSISNGTTSQRIDIRITANAFQTVGAFNNSAELSITGGTAVNGATYKMAVAYKTNDAALYVNGVQIGTDSLLGVVGTFDRIGFDVAAGTQRFNSPVNDAALFTRRLTNAELAAITTL